MCSTRETWPRELRDVPEEQRWNNLIDVSLLWTTVDGDRHQHLPSRVCLCHSFASERSEAPRLQTCKKDTSKPKPSAMCEASMDDEIECDHDYTESGRWKRRRSEQHAHVPRVTSAGCPTSQSSPSCHQVNARQIPSSPRGSDKRGPDGKVKCRLAMHVFKKWVATDLRFAATPLRVTLRVL